MNLGLGYARALDPQCAHLEVIPHVTPLSAAKIAFVLRLILIAELNFIWTIHFR